MRVRTLCVVLGDQLCLSARRISELDPKRDLIWMAEATEESTHVWSSKQRITLFLSAMRHFRDELLAKGFQVQYHTLTAQPSRLGDLLAQDLRKLRPERVQLERAGDLRVERALLSAVGEGELDYREDESFFSTPKEFADYARGKKMLRMEFYYRILRRKHRILMRGEEPEGGSWNYDASNREPFPKSGPGKIKRAHFEPDALTRQVMLEVEKFFPDHPGELREFVWPVTRAEAKRALRNFVSNHLADFGRHQDAMWLGEAFLHHSLLASSLNLKLLSPREVVEAALEAYQRKEAPLESVEGFVRQILGWREYIRGIYFLLMPEYLERNALEARASLPQFYWTGDTEYACLRDAIGQTLRYGYAHHIQRLMVTGLFALLLGVDPKQVHAWYLSVYVDAVEWVELPNTVGMSQFADGGVLASKPYIASGKYIARMSNACSKCRFNPDQATGPDACPFTTLYWDFVDRHRALLKKNPRIGAQVANYDRMDSKRKSEIRRAAQGIRAALSQ
jgi:deoxyribodipyrimidine photolyase-related protein